MKSSGSKLILALPGVPQLSEDLWQLFRPSESSFLGESSSLFPGEWRAKQGTSTHLTETIRKHKALPDCRFFSQQNEIQKMQMEPRLGSQEILWLFLCWE